MIKLKTYRADGFQKVKAQNALAAARIFCDRQARKIYGSSSRVKHVKKNGISGRDGEILFVATIQPRDLKPDYDDSMERAKGWNFVIYVRKDKD